MDSEINIGLLIESLIQYGLTKKLIDSSDVCLVRNNLMDLLKAKQSYTGIIPKDELDAGVILNDILQYCFVEGILSDSTVTQRDLLSAKIMGLITPKPARVVKNFDSAYYNSPMEATDYFYNFCLDVNYIQNSRAKKNFLWDNEEPYGRLELINNFQRHEKTAEEIEKRNKTEKPVYPLCDMCKENVGYAGNLWTEAKQNLRIVPLTLSGRKFNMQYSTEQICGERFYLAADLHEPLATDEKTFEMMLGFVDRFPHCFIGLDAELPGLGNKYAEHGCFEGGCHVFPLDYAETLVSYKHELFDGVETHVLNWPVSVIRLICDDALQLSRAAEYINEFWKAYSDESLGIVPYTENAGDRVRHNALTAAARKNAHGLFELDIALRNNRTDEEHPYGVFGCPPKHANVDLNEIGLLGVMGRATFPGGYDLEMLRIMSCLMSGSKYERGKIPIIDKHMDWINILVDKYGTVDNYETAKSIICFETARKYAKILAACGVFKICGGELESFKSFMDDMGFIETEY